MAEKEDDNQVDVSLNRLNSIANNLTSYLSSSSSSPTPPQPVFSSAGQNDLKQEPDPDTIKMFVGQIPKDWGEDECRQLLQEFGEIYRLNILKDKRTGASRGCCFVTYFTRRSALEAQNALHNIRVLPRMHHAIQMKPADSENRNDRKLFVGMLARSYSESDVCKLFSPFGTIEECTILRDTNGQSKGCAFVTFSSRSNAITAIKVMNHSQTLEGCTSPLVVKFADSQKEKDARKQQQHLVQQLWAAVANPSISPTNYTSSWNIDRQSSPVPVCPIIFDNSSNLMSMAATHQPHQQQIAAAASLALQQQLAQSVNTSDAVTFTAPTLASVLAALCGSSGSNNSATNHLTSVALNNGAFNGLNISQIKNHLPGVMTLQTFPNAISSVGTLNKLASQSAISQLALATCQQTNKPLQGPDGCNLFIYHLPAEYTDSDLTQAFASFGNIISSKVFIDKNTNLSKCFGFVSFDNPLSAQSAIKAMDGFKIGNKRLKVQLKKSKDKPY